MKKISFNIPLQLNSSIENVNKFLKSRKPLHGPGVNIKNNKKKIKKFYKFKNIHLTNSCTSALEMCGLMLKLKKDDEVIVPAFSFITTDSSSTRTGCKLRYCDIKKENLMPS